MISNAFGRACRQRPRRPWKNFADFQTEVGKATSAAEATRLEQYFFIPVDLNTFTNDIMDTFAAIGVGTTRWKREFAEYRPWTSQEQFEREIGKYVRSNPGEVARLEQYMFIPIDINTAGDSLVATFAPIGVGTRRWIREFKEYRPWTSAEQFQREIGKYVRGNPKEVSRLWRYVVIK